MKKHGGGVVGVDVFSYEWSRRATRWPRTAVPPAAAAQEGGDGEYTNPRSPRERRAIRNPQPAVTSTDFTLAKGEQRCKPTAPEAKSVLIPAPRYTRGTRRPTLLSFPPAGGGKQR